ncbi:MAG: GHKL domain-containing protein [Lachnospiraceae bacterium]|nr:GHKL domain-containing protein [Lachnospiraceae bacterium]
MSKRQLFRAASLFVFLYIIYILVIVAMPYGVRSAEVQAKESIQITDAVLTYNGESMPVTLPYSLKGLEIGTEVIVRMTVPDADFGYICVKSVYSPLNAKIEGVFDESYGQRGTYPDCMSDPPTFFKLIPVKEKISGKTLELRYEYPSAMQELYIYAPIYGSYMAIARKLGERTGIAYIAGIFMMVLGVAFIFSSVIVMIFEKKGIVFFWLGCFCMSVGLWNFGESDVAWFVMDNFTAMYFCDYMGMFLLVPMLHQLVIEMVKFHHYKILRINTILSYLLLDAFVILQLTGKVMLSKSLDFYVYVVPYVLVCLIGMLVYEWLKYDNINAKRLLVPVVILIISATMEIINYCFGLSRSFSVAFQIGMIIFFGCVAMIGGNYIKDIIGLRDEEKAKENELKMLKIRIEHGKRRQETELKAKEEVRRQRHDLRHQLTVLKEMNESGQKEQLSKYLDELIDRTVVKNDVVYCENIAVNAVIGYYASAAEENEIDCSVKTVVPATLENITDSELCIIFGNMMENAIEACGRMKKGKKYLSIRSIIKFDKLVVTMDNSFEGKVKIVDKQYVSSKRNAIGIGLQSIKTVAEQHGGNATFENDGEVFHSSVYVKI